MTAPDRKEPKVLTALQIENQREELCDEMPDFWKPHIDALCDTAAQAPALAAEVEALKRDYATLKEFFDLNPNALGSKLQAKETEVEALRDLLQEIRPWLTGWLNGPHKDAVSPLVIDIDIKLKDRK